MLHKSHIVVSAVIMALVGIPLITAACGGTTQTTPTPNPTAVAVGKQLYDTNCASCHGDNGAGGKKIGDATSADIRFGPLNDMYNGDWSLAKGAILDGKDEEGEDLDAAMPRWRGKLSNEDVDNIIQYLKTLK